MSNSPINYILGIRGATTATENTSDAILNATEELLQSIVEVNQNPSTTTAVIKPENFNF